MKTEILLVENKGPITDINIKITKLLHLKKLRYLLNTGVFPKHFLDCFILMIMLKTNLKILDEINVYILRSY